jgi:hypothetical protein
MYAKFIAPKDRLFGVVHIIRAICIPNDVNLQFTVFIIILSFLLVHFISVFLGIHSSPLTFGRIFHLNMVRVYDRNMQWKLCTGIHNPYITTKQDASNQYRLLDNICGYCVK